ncbi:hypothetical protein Y032_0387g455 [Ancylostoma ceylanicum]|uniref:Uncharacterized protein n=1 Tax=Ancylostoma ceylanicum TaxID=53326 RepID=A0A016RSK0_9BILA|nr:hypothetical protein Y032_0387g455 [Ancylostoma ceylanicum]
MANREGCKRVSECIHTHSELQTVVDKGRDHGVAFLGRDTGALHACSGCLLLPAALKPSATPQQTTRASMRSPCVSAQERCAGVQLLVYGRLGFAVHASKHKYILSAIVVSAAPGHPVTTTAGKLLVTTIPSWRVAQPTAKAVGSNSTSTKKSKTRAPKGKSKRTRKKPSKTTKAMAYIPEPEPWGSGKLVDDYYEANHEHEERKKPNTLFAAVLLSLVIANMIFVVLLVICLMLYLKVKRLEVMRPHGREAKFARRSRSKPSSRQKKSMSSAGAEGDDPLRRNGEKRTQSQMSSLQDQADKSAKNRNGANIDAAAAAASPNAATPEAVEFTGIPLTIKNPTPKMGYQDHLNAPPPKAPSRNVPVTALPDNAPVNAMAPNSPVNPVHHNPVAASPTVGPAQRNVPASPARNAPTRSITGAPATVNTQQQKFNVPQNRMKQSIDVPVRQPIRGVSPGVGPRNVQSVTLM